MAMARPKELRATAKPSKPGKAPPVWVDSDDLTIEAGGAEYHPHAGEGVYLRPVMAVEQVRQLSQIMRVVVDLDEIEGEADEQVRRVERLAGCLEEIAAFLAGRLTGWTWTDDDGAPLPAPDAATLGRLSVPELYWLLRVARGETGAQRGNA